MAAAMRLLAALGFISAHNTLFSWPPATMAVFGGKGGGLETLPKKLGALLLVLLFIAAVFWFIGRAGKSGEGMAVGRFTDGDQATVSPPEEEAGAFGDSRA
jgi:hypothetical protein